MFCRNMPDLKGRVTTREKEKGKRKNQRENQGKLPGEGELLLA